MEANKNDERERLGGRKNGRKQEKQKRNRTLPAMYCVKVGSQEGKETGKMSKCSRQKGKKRLRRSR
jgi:hypothetical protein